MAELKYSYDELPRICTFWFHTSFFSRISIFVFYTISPWVVPSSVDRHEKQTPVDLLFMQIIGIFIKSNPLFLNYVLTIFFFFAFGSSSSVVSE